MTVEDLEERLRHELQAKLTFVEKASEKPTEEEVKELRKMVDDQGCQTKQLIEKLENKANKHGTAVKDPLPDIEAALETLNLEVFALRREQDADDSDLRTTTTDTKMTIDENHKKVMAAIETLKERVTRIEEGGRRPDVLNQAHRQAKKHGAKLKYKHKHDVRLKRSKDEIEKSGEKGAKNGGTNTIADCGEEIQELDRALQNISTRPRQFGVRLLKNQERDLSCTYCQERGSHYSDACPTVRTVSKRKRILREEGRCKECLGVHEGKCEKGSKCFYCNFRKLHNQEATDHHASICTSSEELVELEEQRKRAREERDYCIRRLADIDEESH
ncbi:unnamed protein product [Heligmosomoides polygyrus]|uniref:CCHC-type domain-containing protein n=1 Tax=Heligmosomoides polygyrus TaxID=6339 RepID=A0A183FP49_HELPZ|nr:unnamed protein product [Heligmosomoides polygyrus]